MRKALLPLALLVAVAPVFALEPCAPGPTLGIAAYTIAGGFPGVTPEDSCFSWYADNESNGFTAVRLVGGTCLIEHPNGGSVAIVEKVCEPPPEGRWWEAGGSIFDVSPEAGAAISGAVALIWVLGWAIRQLIRMLRDSDGDQPSIDE